MTKNRWEITRALEFLRDSGLSDSVLSGLSAPEAFSVRRDNEHSTEIEVEVIANDGILATLTLLGKYAAGVHIEATPFSAGQYPFIEGVVTLTFEEDGFALWIYAKIKAPREYYQAYLRTEIWRSFRARILNERGFKCEVCRAKKNLHLHHLTYERLGDEADQDVMILCQRCHNNAHKN